MTAIPTLITIGPALIAFLPEVIEYPTPTALSFSKNTVFVDAPPTGAPDGRLDKFEPSPLNVVAVTVPPTESVVDGLLLLIPTLPPLQSKSLLVIIRLLLPSTNLSTGVRPRPIHLVPSHLYVMDPAVNVSFVLGLFGKLSFHYVC